MEEKNIAIQEQAYQLQIDNARKALEFKKQAISMIKEKI